MKKVFAILLVLALILSSFAFAADDSWDFSLAKKSGGYTGTKLKRTGDGVNGSFKTSGGGTHSMYYQIRKHTGWEASNYLNTKAAGTFSLSYMKDGYGNSRGQENVKYKLRVAHRSQCTCKNGTASLTISNLNP